LRSTFPDQLVTWSSRNSSASFFIQLTGKTLLVQHNSQSHSFSLPFDFPIWVENLTHAIVAALYLGTSQTDIQARLSYLSPVKMRLSMVHGVNDSYVIDDTYNNDLQGLEVALDYLSRQTEKKVKTLILSDLLDSGLPEKELYLQTSKLLNQAKIDRVYLIGSRITKHTSLIQNVAGTFLSVSDFLTKLPDFSKEIILLKGARRFSFERIVKKIESKSHRTRLEINFEAIVHNLNAYRSVIQPGTKIMAMVKAFGYGSGSSEIANLLQFHNVDYLGVAYTDEAIALRKSGIRVPIMIMSPDEINLDQLSELQIEAEVYSMERVRSVCEMANPPAIHLKIETGMNRLGLVADEWLPAARLLADHPNVKIAGIFTHLAAADDSRLDEFTVKQIRRFEEAFNIIASTTNQQPLKHLLNTSGVSRFPNTQNDMVRIGIGLYGYDPTHQLQLRSTSTLKTFVTQIKEVKAGEPVGYGCAWTAPTDTRIAIVPIGYADGFDRRNSKGIGYMAWNGKKLPVIGNVCMDMTMLEVGDLTIEPEDPIEIFGETISLEDVAQRIGTIPYEILTSISARVKRIYLSE
ncbi:MAG: alanine racemase, partial [Cellvibrionaceae bacterium]